MRLYTWETDYVCVCDNLTCGKDYIPGNQFVVDDGKLRELDSGHPRHGGLPSFPVELDVICGVSICERECEQGGQVWVPSEVNHC